MKRPNNSTLKQQDNSAIDMAEHLAILVEKDEIIGLKTEVILSQKKRISILEEALRLSKVKRFTSTSEQSGQQELFDEAELEALPEASSDETEDDTQAAPKKKKPGRKPFADSLPREQIFINLSDEEKEGAVDTFYSKVKEELDIIPAQVRVLEYMQEKAVFTEQGQRKIQAALMPKHPVPRAMGSIGLMSYIIISKYSDGLPLYRLENILARYGGDISRTTMANWVIAIAKQLQPIINLLREHQHGGNIIMADETRVQVLNEKGRDPTSNKYMWVTIGGPPDEKSVLFEYDKSRGQEVPLRLLNGFTGYLQTDGYAGYEPACRKYGLTHLGCWDHARRKFKEAQAAQPKKKKRQQAH